MAVADDLVDVGLVRNEQLDASFASGLHGEKQWLLSILGFGVRACTELQQSLDHLVVVVAHREVKSRVIRTHSLVHVDVSVEYALSQQLVLDPLLLEYGCWIKKKKLVFMTN